MFNENFLGFLKVYKQNIVAGRLFLFVDKTKANKCDCVSVRSSKQTVKMPKTKTKGSTQLEVLGPSLSLCVPIMMTETDYGAQTNHIKTPKYLHSCLEDKPRSVITKQMFCKILLAVNKSHTQSSQTTC